VVSGIVAPSDAATVNGIADEKQGDKDQQGDEQGDAGRDNQSDPDAGAGKQDRWDLAAGPE
jgi:hypothetical protein